jgi:hypothetical protein
MAEIKNLEAYRAASLAADKTTSGGGPEDPMLEQRVAKLEEKVDRIEAILQRLEPKITEALLTNAKQADLSKLQVQIVEFQATAARQADLQKLQVDIAEVKGGVASLPTWWMLIIAIISTWGAGFAMSNYASRHGDKTSMESQQK